MTDFKAIASSLEERGFCVIPEFLSHEEIAAILTDVTQRDIRLN